MENFAIVLVAIALTFTANTFILISGGVGAGSTEVPPPFPNAAEPDPPLKLVSVNASLPTPVVVPRAIYDGQDTVYLIGGRPGQDKVIKYSLLDDTVQIIGTFKNLSSGAALLNGGNIIYFGGIDGPITAEPQVQDDVFSFSIEHGNYTLVNHLPRPLRSIAHCEPPGARAAYLYGGFCNSTNQAAEILKYDTNTHKIETVAELPESRYGMGSYWDAKRAVAYLFGGASRASDHSETSTSDILQFNPATNRVTKLAHTLAAPVVYPCAVFERNSVLFMVRTFATSIDLVTFNPANEETKRIAVGILPLAKLESFACVYVPKLDRIYVFGGEFTTYDGSREPVPGDHIFYVDMSTLVLDPTTTSKPGDIPTFFYVVGAVVAMALLAVGLGGALLWLRGRKVIDQVELDKFHLGDLEAPEPDLGAHYISAAALGMPDLLTSALIRPFDKRFEMQRRKFAIDKRKILGTGAYGRVYGGTLGTTQVAVKVPHHNCPELILIGLLKELKIMSSLRHENIVSLLGANTARAAYGKLYIVMEFCKHGSIQQFFEERTAAFVDATNGRSAHYVPIVTFGFSDLLRWCRQVAEGMDFLASRRIVHRDIAARNILLTETLQAKVSDFGLSRQLYGNPAYEQQSMDLKLPYRWMAIECFSGKFSTESDVWAYGILASEIFSLGSLPYADLEFTDAGHFVDFLQAGLRITERGHATPEIFEKLNECWQEDPRDRPTFAVLKEFFTPGESIHC